MTAEDRARLAQESGLQEPIVTFSAARAKLMTLQAVGGAFVQRRVDKFLPPDCDPVDQRAVLDHILATPDPELTRELVNAFLEKAQKQLQEQKRRTLLRNTGLMALVGVIIGVAYAAWRWGDLFPGPVGGVLSQAEQARALVEAWADLGVTVGLYAAWSVAAVCILGMFDLVDLAGRPAWRAILGEEIDLAKAEVAVTSPKVVKLSNRLLRDRINTLPAVAASFIVALAAWQRWETPPAVLGGLIGLALCFSVLTSGWVQVRLLQAYGDRPRARQIQTRLATAQVLTTILAAACIVCLATIVIPLLLDHAASPLLRWGVGRHVQAAEVFATLVEQSDLAAEARAAALGANRLHVAQSVELLRSLASQLPDVWDRVARACIVGALVVCLAMAVFQFVYVNRARGLRFIALWFGLLAVTQVLPEPISNALGLSPTAVAGFLVTMTLAAVGSVASELFIGRVEEPVRSCPKCGTAVEREHLFCHKCGQALDKPQGITP